MKYCLWNNKGGVGKTFLSFCLSVEYAIKYPDKAVVVVDMCPQANITEMLLGGNHTGEDKQIELRKKGSTIVNYIENRYLTSQFSKLGNESAYFTRVYDYNDKMPNNLYLLAGDMNLDLCASLIEDVSAAKVVNSWGIGRSYLKDLLDAFDKDTVTEKREKVFFIDCNPSFSAYTELAILASDKLIVPCTGDTSSTRGFKNIMRLVYGNSSLENDENEYDDDKVLLQLNNFNEKAKENKMRVPSIHSVIVNKSRTRDKKATIAYKGHVDNLQNIIKDYYETNVSLFDYKEIKNIKDGNNIAVIVNYMGIPVSNLVHQKYEIHGKRSQINQLQIDALKSDIDEVLVTL